MIALAVITPHDLLLIRRVLRPQLGTRGDPEDADGEIFYILPGTGPLGSVFFRALEFMSDVNNALVDRQPSERSSVSLNADNTFREDRTFIEDELESYLLAQVENPGPSTAREQFNIGLLRSFRRILIRLDEPGRYNVVENQQDFDWLNEHLMRFQLRLDVADFPGWTTFPRHRQILRIMARRIPDAATDADINPAGAQRARNLEILQTRLREVEGLAADVTDSIFVRGFTEIF